MSEPAPVLDFGTAVHSACEHYLKTREVDLAIVQRSLDEAWAKNIGKKGYDEKAKEDLLEVAAAIMAEVPTFMDKTFNGWRYVEAEELLYEDVDKTDVKFKGLIDGVIMVPTTSKAGKTKELCWIIDWKTSAWGWSTQKKSDFKTKMQIILYKYFWSLKHKVDQKDIRAGFVILKKAAKVGNHCELISVSVGPVTVNRSLKILNNAINGIKKGISIKNRNSCKYCEFFQTQHCT